VVPNSLPAPAVVAYSPHPSVADLLKRVLEGAGFRAWAVWAPEELEAAVGRVRPEGIVYEIGFPFAEHWRELQALRQRALLKTLPFIIATGEPQELYRRIGVAADLEIFVRPKDSEQVRATVRGAIAGGSAGTAPTVPDRVTSA
jgi:DNA-binding response OmpR family regulator